MNAKNHTKMATNPEYVGEVSGIRYRLTTNNIMSQKDKNKAKIKGQTKIVLDCRSLNKI